jgi:hypothetical protein
LVENLSVNSLKGDLSNATTFNPPLFPLDNTFNVQVAMVLLAHRYEDVRQIWAGIWAAYPRDVDLVGREGGIVTSSSLFLSHIRFVMRAIS